MRIALDIQRDVGEHLMVEVHNILFHHENVLEVCVEASEFIASKGRVADSSYLWEGLRGLHFDCYD